MCQPQKRKDCVECRYIRVGAPGDGHRGHDANANGLKNSLRHLR